MDAKKNQEYYRRQKDSQGNEEWQKAGLVAAPRFHVFCIIGQKVQFA
jgi:hypothetical protein